MIQHIGSGKVREIFAVDDERLVLFTSDRISAYDVVMHQLIPDKGRVLTGLSAYWFNRTQDIVDNHMITCDPKKFPEEIPSDWHGRAMLVRKSVPLKIECIVRGYMFGHAWYEYRDHGTVNGIEFPKGIKEAQQLSEPIFTPSTKAEEGHDVALTYNEALEIVSESTYKMVADTAIELYKRGAKRAKECGIILADTKFEFGELPNGDIILIDEAMTPDSSRYWPTDQYKVGISPPSFDKQYLRDFLNTLDWDRTPPPPDLPEEVVAGTRERYVEAYERVTGDSLDNWF